MANVEYLMDRVNSLNEKIAKSESIIAKKSLLAEKKRVELSKLTNEDERYWKQCEIRDAEDSCYDHQKKIAEYKESLTKCQNLLDAENSTKRDLPVLVEFLNAWKNKVMGWLLEQFKSEERISLLNQVKDASVPYREFRNKTYRMLDYREMVREKYKTEYETILAEYKERVDLYTTLKNKYESNYQTFMRFEADARDHQMSFEDWTEKELNQMWIKKYDDLVSRVGSITGKIIDCSFLRVNATGMLDGVVTGEKGKAYVNTIGAGGWNIQCFHYRVLVKEIR